MKQVLKQLTILSSFIYALTFLGCTDMETFFPEITSAFTFTINEDSGTVTFINTSEGADKYEWSFGDGETSTEINPIKTYAASGTYTVTLKASNLAGASDTSEAEVSLQIPQAVVLPITFDDPNVNYNVATFDGTSFEIVDNPDESGSNAKATKVGAITNGGNAFEGVFIDLGADVDLSEGNTITMNFWADTPVPVLLKLEEGTAAAVEIPVDHGGTGWEALSFTFDSDAAYSRLTLFADGPGTTAGTFYLDDIAQADAPGGGEDCTAETAQSLDAADFNLTFQTDPGSAIISAGGAFSYIDNPDTDNDVNPSCKVGQIDRDPNLDFANTQIDFETKFDFNTNAGFKLKVWAPEAGTNVLVKLEDKTSSGAVFTEVSAATTVANAWEELTFDFPASESDKYDKIVLFFKPGEFVAETYYIDDFALYSDDGGGTDCVAETEQSLAASDFNLTFQTDPGSAIISAGGAFSYIDNPDTDNDVNPSCKVGQIDRDPNLNFANTQIDFETKFDFNTNAGFKLKVWAPEAGTNVLVKLEDKTSSGAVFTEVSAATTVANAWEELTFDFPASESDKYDKIVLFFEPGQFVPGTYYIDDFALYGDGNGGTPPVAATALPVTFESNETLSGVFEGDGVTGVPIANPDPSGINTSATVFEFNKANGAAWFSGMFNVFASDIDPSAGNTFKVKMWSPKANINVRFQLEKEGNQGPIPTYQVDQTLTEANTWVELTFDFSGTAINLADGYDKIVIFPDFDDVGQPAGDGSIYYVDDIIQEVGGGGGTPPTPPAFPIDFEDGGDYFGAFEGGATAQNIANPQPTGNPSSRVLEFNKAVGSAWFSGIFFDKSSRAPDAPIIETDNGTVFRVKIWSPKAGINVRMRLQGDNDGNDATPVDPAFNVDVLLETANQWVELTFDFTSQVGANSFAYDEFVIQPNLDEVGQPAPDGSIYYIDDIIQE